MIKKLLRFTLFISLIFVSKNIEAQGSDFQCTPTDLGFLPLATPPCSSSSGVSYGSPITQVGTTLGATNDSLSGFIMSCYSGPPLRDVWYSFNATETHVEIQIQGAGATPLQDSYIAIYEVLTGECVGLIPRECSIGSGTGLHTMEFGPLTLGVKYYLQIASGTGSTIGDGGFTIAIKSKTICSDCSKNSVLNAYPLPVNAAYPPDTTVGFCYSVIGYNGLFGNGFHGMVPLFGSGWDATTFTVYDAPDSADLAGQWKWFSGLNIGGTSGTVSGFFYDIGGDNDPRNNLGDHGTFSTIWTFCFTIKTQTAALCNSGLNDLSIRFLNYADGESGSLVSTYDCSGDEDYIFDAHMECCPKPAGVYAQAAGCNNTPDGSIVVYAGFSFAGHDYFLYDSDGNLVATHTSAPASVSPYTFTGLYEGNYYLYFNENTGGACQTGYNVYVPGPVEYDIQQTVFGCPGSSICNNSAEVIVTSGSVASVTWSNGETGFIADSLCAGLWNYVTIVDTGSVACVIYDSIFITNFPFASPFFDYNQTNYCTSDSFAVVTDFPAAGGGVFSILTYPIGMGTSDINPSTGTVDVSGATVGGFLIIKYTSAPPCSNIHYDTLIIEISPPPPLASIFPSQNLCVGDIANSYLNSSLYDVHWFSDTALTTSVTIQTAGTTFDNFGGTPFSTPGIFSFFLVNISTTNSCKSAPLPVTINVYPTPVIDAGPPLTVCPGYGINLLCTGGNSFIWSPASVLNNPNVNSPIATLTSTTLFTVVGTDATSGCSSSDTVTVFVDENGQCDIAYYTGFTPNGDGANDYWHIDGISVDPKNQVFIFNRWGDKVWETTGYNNLTNRWEGRSYRGHNLVPDGTYFFIIKFQDKNYKGYIELTK